MKKTKEQKITDDDYVITQAIQILEKRFSPGQCMTSSNSASNYFIAKLANKEREEFWVMLLNTQHQVLETTCLFMGTIDGATVYPREIVRSALACNAAAIIVAHNHPSGVCDPSQSDKHITQQIKNVCDLFDIRLLDHFIIGAGRSFSFAEKGLL